mmetsp:Transcript_1629/g.3919  ORF Transcript_1629/g.3919 Transcript_1629/m.3919 type:complete len:360 (+) Transcript_1629:124-1203(+)
MALLQATTRGQPCGAHPLRCRTGPTNARPQPLAATLETRVSPPKSEAIPRHGGGASPPPVAAFAVGLGLGSGSLLLGTWTREPRVAVEVLFELLLPAAAALALLASSLLAVRQLARRLQGSGRLRAGRFGRRGLMVSVGSLLFAASCLYRALFVADEGAGLCRGKPTVFNAPAAGRLIATVGEVALVVQISAYLDDTARRLRVSRGLWAHKKRWTYAPVISAECLSWTGVISGVPLFFCCEYVVWMLMAVTWAWDSAELLHMSSRWGDSVGHATLLVASAGLFAFNAFVEIPHFFVHGQDAAAAQAGASMLECFQDVESPIWLKRVPFFAAYFFGCSWCSAAMSYRYFVRGGWRHKGKA